MKPLVTIILPVYNASKFLNRSLDSILGQSFNNFELLIIDDGSTDGSENIIKGYNDPRIRYNYQKNQGVAATLNHGISMANGKYIWRHDADDISAPNKLQKQVNFLEVNPRFALCACQIAFMTESGKVAKAFRQPKTTIFEGKAYLDVERRHFNPYSPITHGTVLIRTDTMRWLGGYREEFITGEDIDLWLRLIQTEKAAVLNEVLSYHRLSKTSATQVHGWKNEFFRNLAFEYFDQREKTGQDDLQRGLKIELPSQPISANEMNSPGKRFRDDLLHFQYPLHLNAGDYAECWRLLAWSIRDGWRLRATWKAILFPLVGPKNTRRLVDLKRAVRFGK